jgi:hypothetical protein
MEVHFYEGCVDLEVIGEASYQDNLWWLVAGRSSSNDRVRVDVYAVLVAETGNEYYANAVSVWVQGPAATDLDSRVANLVFGP